MEVIEGSIITFIVPIFLMGIAQLVYAIFGLVQASKGREVRLPVIPFIRRPAA